MKHIVFSDYINAWSIKKGLNNLGLNLKSTKRTNNLIEFIDESQVKKEDVLFFTEESNLKRYLDSKDYNFLPRNFPIELLDDKLKFAEFLTEMDETPVPSKKLAKNENSYPFFLKSKHSWIDGKKLPRGFICHNVDEFNYFLQEIDSLGLQKSWFFQQKLLNSSLDKNISVSGFFDYKKQKRNIMIVSRKLLGDDEKIATGVVIETIRDPKNLIDRTKRVLETLNYVGPFELEFFYEELDKEFYILELNPRFWMQHGIFIDLYNNGLIKRYLNVDTEDDWYENGVPDYQHIVWVDNLYYIKSILKCDTRVIRNIKKIKGQKIYYPDNKTGCQYWVSKAVNKLIRKIGL